MKKLRIKRPDIKAAVLILLLSSCSAKEETFAAPPSEQLYSTPYGTFPVIEEIWQKNEYMLAHPSHPGDELCTAYLTDDPGNADAVRAELASLADEITAGCGTELEKAEALAMWTGTNIAYDFDSADESGGLSVMTAEAVLRDRRTTCTGFANLFMCLCAAEDIYCLFIMGGSASGGWQRNELTEAPANHAWNAFCADGQWYFADPAWIGDLSYENGRVFGGENILPFYARFGFGEMCTEHRIDRCEYMDVFDRNIYED